MLYCGNVVFQYSPEKILSSLQTYFLYSNRSPNCQFYIVPPLSSLWDHLEKWATLAGCFTKPCSDQKTKYLSLAHPDPKYLVGGLSNIGLSASGETELFSCAGQGKKKKGKPSSKLWFNFDFFFFGFELLSKGHFICQYNDYFLRFHSYCFLLRYSVFGCITKSQRFMGEKLGSIYLLLRRQQYPRDFNLAVLRNKH